MDRFELGNATGDGNQVLLDVAGSPSALEVTRVDGRWHFDLGT